jgi:multiple sugar transport system ATP-binding protein
MTDNATAADVRLDDVSKVYGKDVLAVDHVSLEVQAGEFMVLVGPSGCGKSTLLRMIAGLEDVTAGAIHIGGHDVTDLPARSRDVAMVFQNYALYPHMSVRSNLAFGVRMRRTPGPEIRRRVIDRARMLGLTDLLDRRPAQLSGGQRQRVAMGRAMVRQPVVYLLDEPLSNLDAKLRVAMRAELGRLHERLGVTTIYVTHDQVEAMTLGSRVAVLHEGVLQQCAPPQELFDRPVNLFVAAFIGSPPMNLVGAVVEDGRLSFGGFDLNVPNPHLPAATGSVILGVRPQDLAVAEEGAPARMTADVDLVEDLGTESNVMFSVNAPPVATDVVVAVSEGDDTRLLMDDERARWAARITGRRHITPGSTVELAIDTRHLQYFDPDSRLAIPRRSMSAG